jgi:hypothetical protein
VAAESRGVVGVQVDLVVGAADPEPPGLVRRPPSRSSSKTTVIFVAIEASLPVMGYLHGTITSPAVIKRYAATAAPARRFGEPTAKPTTADVRPRQATTSHGFRS